MLRIALLLASLAGVGAVGWAVAESPTKPLSDPKKNLPPEGGTPTSAS